MSIKRQLILLIIATVTLATFFAALHGYRNSKAQLDIVFDQELVSVAQFISKVAQHNIEFPSSIDGQLAYQVFVANTLVSKSANAPLQPMFIATTGFSEATFFHQRWRTFTLNSQANQVVVAHPIGSRIESAESILFVTVAPILTAIPLIAFIIYYIIQKSLKPLLLLSLQIKQKSTDDLTAISIHEPPEELAPVINRLNLLLSRLDDSFEREKQLSANAAHELRTPVSVLALTAHNILQDFDQQLLTRQSVLDLRDNVERMAHVIEQMISLYRFTPEQFRVKKSAIDIENVLQEVISAHYHDIDKNGQSISLEGQTASVLGEKFALYILFENVLRNAIKYSGTGSQIRLEMQPNNHHINIDIDDSGEGVNQAEYDKIFERFYRSPEQASGIKGSGLGLSIVKHITALHEGEIKCSRSDLGGLRVSISLPLNNAGKLS